MSAVVTLLNSPQVALREGWNRGAGITFGDADQPFVQREPGKTAFFYTSNQGDLDSLVRHPDLQMSMQARVVMVQCRLTFDPQVTHARGSTMRQLVRLGLFTRSFRHLRGRDRAWRYQLTSLGFLYAWEVQQ